MGLPQDTVDVIIRDVVAQGNGRLFCSNSGAAGSLGNRESSLVGLLDAGTGTCHAVRTANPTAVTAGRLLGKKDLRVSVLYHFWLKFPMKKCLTIGLSTNIIIKK